MRLMDGQLRKDLLKNRAWLRIFGKVRRGYRCLSLYKDYKGFRGHGSLYFLQRAEEVFTEALQEIAQSGLTGTELERMAEKGLNEVMLIQQGENVFACKGGRNND